MLLLFTWKQLVWIGAAYTILLNLRKYGYWIYPVMAAALALWAMAAFYVCRKASAGRAPARAAPYALIACVPFAWFTVIQHHSGLLHIWFTFRIVGVTALAFAAAGVKLFRPGREKRAFADGLVVFRTDKGKYLVKALALCEGFML